MEESREEIRGANSTLRKEAYGSFYGLWWKGPRVQRGVHFYYSRFLV